MTMNKKMRVKYCVLENNRDTKPIVKVVKWSNFVKKFENPKARGEMTLNQYLKCKDDPDRRHLADNQKNGPAFIPGVFSKLGTRKIDDMSARCLLILDLDDGYYKLSEISEKLNEYEAIIHTSYSYSKKKRKYRVILPFDRVITKDIEATVSRILDYFKLLLGDHIDDKCWTVNQLYYMPSCPRDAVDLYRCKHLIGSPIKVSDFILSEPINHDLVAAAGKPSGTRPGDDFNQRGNLKELLEGLGWRHFFTNKTGNIFMTRPGKKSGISAVIFKGSNVLYVFSSDEEVAPFEAGKAYSAFSAYALIKHNGDYTAAAKQLKSEGYGDCNSTSDTSQEEHLSAERAQTSFPEIAFPLDVFPEYFQGLVEVYARALQCSPTFIAINFMAVISGAAGNTVAMAIKKSWLTAPFLWVVIIDESGLGKTHPINAAMKPLHRRQARADIKFEEATREYKRALSKFKKERKGDPPVEPKPISHYYSNDFTIEVLIPIFKVSARGIVLHVDELAGLFRSLNQYRNGKGSDEEKILSLFNCGQIKSDRISGGGFCRESGAAVIGGIQPKIFPIIFGDKERENGMVFRFLPVLLNAAPPVFTEEDISEAYEKEWDDLVGWMYSIKAPVNGQTGCISKTQLKVNTEGKRLYKAFYDDLSALQPFMPYNFRGYLPKLQTYCLKFIAVLHLLKCYQHEEMTTTVEESTVEGAIQLTRYFAGQAMKLALRVATDRNPHSAIIRSALISLRAEVKGGKIRLSRVLSEVNRLLPSNLDLEVESKELATWLREMGLEVKAGTNNKSVVIWDSAIVSS